MKTERYGLKFSWFFSYICFPYKCQTYSENFALFFVKVYYSSNLLLSTIYFWRPFTFSRSLLPFARRWERKKINLKCLWQLTGIFSMLYVLKYIIYSLWIFNVENWLWIRTDIYWLGNLYYPFEPETFLSIDPYIDRILKICWDLEFKDMCLCQYLLFSKNPEKYRFNRKVAKKSSNILEIIG